MDYLNLFLSEIKVKNYLIQKVRNNSNNINFFIVGYRQKSTKKNKNISKSNSTILFLNSKNSKNISSEAKNIHFNSSIIVPYNTNNKRHLNNITNFSNAILEQNLNPNKKQTFYKLNEFKKGNTLKRPNSCIQSTHINRISRKARGWSFQTMVVVVVWPPSSV